MEFSWEDIGGYTNWMVHQNDKIFVILFLKYMNECDHTFFTQIIFQLAHQTIFRNIIFNEINGINVCFRILKIDPESIIESIQAMYMLKPLCWNSYSQ